MTGDGRRSYRLLGYAVPLAILTFLLLTYLIARDFYLNWVISRDARESQIVEITTFVSSAIASLVLLVCSKLLWTLRRKEALGSCLLLVLLGVAALFFAGEEVSWGQTYLKWETPASYQEFSGETNLHNTSLPVNTLGGLFLAAYFFALPLLWQRQKGSPLWQHFSYAIPKGPVVFCMAVAFLWKGFKSAYRTVYTSDVQQSSVFYRDFLEQINEHKEMLVAIALLMYACSSYITIRGLVGETDVPTGRSRSRESQPETPS